MTSIASTSFHSPTHGPWTSANRAMPAPAGRRAGSRTRMGRLLRSAVTVIRPYGDASDAEGTLAKLSALKVVLDAHATAEPAQKAAREDAVSRQIADLQADGILSHDLTQVRIGTVATGSDMALAAVEIDGVEPIGPETYDGVREITDRAIATVTAKVEAAARRASDTVVAITAIHADVPAASVAGDAVTGDPERGGRRGPAF